MENYAKVRSVGKGTYGEVYLVKHKVEKHYYVIKRMGLKNASRKERKAAQLEVKLLASLKHPNIISYKESFMDRSGAMYIVMSYCEMGDMYHYLQARKGQLLPEEQVVEWCIQISLALQYMHQRKILHRDLKTQNIFLTKRNYVKLGDLGIARVLDSTVDMATTLIGTPYYMSPELFSNRPYNHKSDIWSLGCCLIEMCTLKHAFDAKDMNQLVFQILRGHCPPLPEQYSSELARLANQLMAQDPDERPTVDEILQMPFIRNNIQLFLSKRGRRPRSASAAPLSRPAAPLPPTPQQVSDKQSDRRQSDSNMVDVRRTDVRMNVMAIISDEGEDEQPQANVEEEMVPETTNVHISAGHNEVQIDPSKIKRSVDSPPPPQRSNSIPPALDAFKGKSADYIVKRAARERRRRLKGITTSQGQGSDSSEANSAANSPSLSTPDLEDDFKVHLTVSEVPEPPKSPSHRRGQDDETDEKELEQVTDLFERTLEGKEQGVSYELFDEPVEVNKKQHDTAIDSGSDGSSIQGSEEENEQLKSTVAKYWAGPNPSSNRAGKASPSPPDRDDASLNSSISVQTKKARNVQPGSLAERIEIVENSLYRRNGQEEIWRRVCSLKAARQYETQSSRKEAGGFNWT